MPKILAIDDINDNLISLKAIIDDAFPGYVLHTALSGLKGIELALAENPDVILLDVIMPGMDGFEVCRLLKLDERVSDIPVVFLTALKGDKENRIKALEVGAEGFLSKPIDETELTAQIRAMVKIKAANEQKRDEKEKLEKLVEERTKELVQSQAQLKSIFDNLQDAYFQADLSGHFTVVSPSSVKMYGYQSPDELIGQPADKLYFDINDRTSLLSALHSTGSIKDYVCQGRKKDGSTFWASMNVQLLKSDDGQIIGTEGVVRDISERIKGEKALGESEKKYRIMVDLLPDAVIVHEGGKFVFANAAALKTVGADSFEQLIERPLMEYVHPDFRNISLSRIKEIYSTGQPSSFSEEKFITLKDEIIDVEVIGIPVTYMGKPAVQTIIRDITKRKRTEQALQESEAQFRGFFEKAADAIFVADINTGIILDVNEAATRLTGKCYDQMIGIHQSQLHPPVKDDYSKETFIKHKELIKQNLSSYALENTVVRADGIEVPVEILASEVDYHGKLCIMGTFRDITERKRTEDTLHENVARLELAMSTANMSWWEMDVTTGNVVFERRKAEMLGYAPEKFKHYTDFTALVHPENYERAMNAMRLHLNGSLNKYEVEYRIKTISGEYKWFYDIGSVTKRDSEGKPLIISGLVLDISQRKHVDEELQNSHNMLEKLAAQVPGVVYQYRLYPDGRSAFPFSSPGMFDIYEVTPDEVREDASSVFTRIHPDDYDYIVETIMESARNQTIYHSEFRVILPNQGLRWRMSDAKPELLEDGSTLWHGIITDITERKQNEEALFEREQLFRGLFDSSPDAIVLIDPHHPTISWPIVDCNEAACKMNGYTREEMIGQSIDLLNETTVTQEGRVAYFKDLLKTGTMHREGTHIHKDGHLFPIEISTSVITIDGREMILGIDRDITERKQAELALKESEERYRQFISQVSEGVYRFECDEPIDISLPLEEQVDFIYDHMFIAECNDAFLKMYGIKHQKEMIGKSHLDFLGGRYHPVNREVLRNFVKNGYHIENAITEECGFEGQHLVINNNWLGICENDHLVRIWGTQFDITEKVRADKVQQVLYNISNATLSASNLTELIEIISKELGNLLDSTNFFIAFYDESTEMLSTLYEKGDRDNINNWPAEKSLTGYIIKHQKSILATETDINQLCETGEIEIVGIPSKIWMGVPLSVNKKVIGAIVVQSYDNPDAFTEKDKLMLEFVSHQISTSIERKKIEQELKLMGKAFDQSPVTIVITDKNGNIEYTNPKFSETTGYTSEEVKGKNTRILQSGNQSKAYYHELWRTILAGNDWFGEFQNKRKNGELYWESAVISPITNESGDISFFMAIKEEITEKKKMITDLIQARNKAEESDRLKSAFLANMSHEIRTPLNSIIGFSELMTDPNFDADQQSEFAKIILNSGNSLLSIISDIMDFSKIEAGLIKVNKFPFVTQRLISQLQKEYALVAQGKGIELRIGSSNPKEDIWITSDENRLKQVLVNLVGNAIKFTKEGYVELGFKITGDCVQFRVSDSGIGIPEEYHNEIFERFRQVESADSRKYGGNGLGLAISKSLVEILGGEIWIESVQGNGSTFYFTIPIGITTT